MPATKVGIIYSKNQKVIRSIIRTDWIGWNADRTPILDPNADDSRLDHHRTKMKNGEEWAEVPISVYENIADHQVLHTHLGLDGIPGVTDRCIVHRNGVVEEVVHGDPAIDTHPRGAIAHDATGRAEKGMVVVNGVVQLPVQANERASERVP